MNETTTLAPGIYRDKDGDTWAILADENALQLSQHPNREYLHPGGPLPVEAIAEHARHGGCRVDSLAAVFGPLTPLHIFGEEGAL